MSIFLIYLILVQYFHFKQFNIYFNQSKLDILQLTILNQSISKLQIKQYKNINKSKAMGAECKATFSSFKIPNLVLKNTYSYLYDQQQMNKQDFRQFCGKIFGNQQEIIDKFKTLLYHLYKTGKIQFVDSNFQIKGQRLSRLYDYGKRSMKLFDNQTKNGLATFSQFQVQFSYLSAVLYFLQKNKYFLRKRILLNQQTNLNKIYAFRLFCNGIENIVVIDDKVPIYNDRLLFTQIQGKQIWPCLVEKAWCKQIGGYDKARGLSPEECFEQITGIPAYSYEISMNGQDQIYKIIKSLLLQDHWLCVVAKPDLGSIKPKQVFVIQDLVQENIFLISPYTNFTYSTYEESKKGYLKLSYMKFLQIFDYLIIGWYKKGYVPISHRVCSQKREQKFYELTVHKQDSISVKFTQFFNGYLNDQEKTNYEYSPLVFFQMYDSKGKLLGQCQGCDRLHAGVHSTYITNKIFQNLQTGTYFIRVEIDWELSNYIKQGNLVVYASENNVNLKDLSYQYLKQNIKKVHSNTLAYSNSGVIQSQKDAYILKFLEKKNNILISIENTGQNLLRLELDFYNSFNFRVKYEKLQSSKKIIVNLSPQQVKFLQIVPEDLRKQFKIEPFAVKKLIIKYD